MEGEREVSETVPTGSVSGFMFPWGTVSGLSFYLPPSFPSSLFPFLPFPPQSLSLSTPLPTLSISVGVLVLVAGSWKRWSMASLSNIILVSQALVNLYLIRLLVFRGHKLVLFFFFFYLSQNLIQFWAKSWRLIHLLFCLFRIYPTYLVLQSLCSWTYSSFHAH